MGTSVINSPMSPSLPVFYFYLKVDHIEIKAPSLLVAEIVIVLQQAAELVSCEVKVVHVWWHQVYILYHCYVKSKDKKTWIRTKKS